MRCGCGEQSGRRAPATKSRRCRCCCRCPQKIKKMGTGVQPLDVPSDLYPARIKSYYILPSPRLALLHVTVHHSHTRSQRTPGRGNRPLTGVDKVRKGDARLLVNWMKLMMVDLLPEPAGYSRKGKGASSLARSDGYSSHGWIRRVLYTIRWLKRSETSKENFDFLKAKTGFFFDCCVCQG